ncbi:Zn-ribbon domain-containing OB-fold protein [Bordetella genomosp. 9]|uniref:ChsH2 C-terminal OB-fold domain-containing protein n=1 Tax=Bordetella genomosp. 9 TaxID=1416803 RepID=A0A1W6YVN0_9BORD|nr:OB-fold domain-containing protein [Bordetella genomosp. 9]ARP85165.1 hypothetical protein CAL13_02235 [Bordetella genomosp. 9]
MNAQTAAAGAARSPYAVYLEHLKAGRLAYQYSTVAGRPVFFPRVLCPYTGLDCLEWRTSGGMGTVYSTSVVYPRKGDPYNVALIDCDEGFRLMSRVEGVAPLDVAIGMRVRFETHAAESDDDDPYPIFRPLQAAGGASND